MSRRWREIVRLRFDGPRFEGHGIEISALTELIEFQELIKDVAKATYRRRHPQAGRLPNRFEEMLVLRFSRIEEDSTAIPLEVCEDYGETLLPFAQATSPAEEAANLVQETVEAAAARRPLPEQFPRSCLSRLSEFGKSLGPEDSVSLSTPARAGPARYDPIARDQVRQLLSSPYADSVKLSGKVLAADVRMSRFVLYPTGQPGVPVTFDESQEAIVLRALSEHRSRFLHVEGSGEYAPDGTLKQVASVTDLRLEDGATAASPSNPIWQRIVELGDQLPVEIVERVPADASARLDEYLYGGRAG